MLAGGRGNLALHRGVERRAQDGRCVLAGKANQCRHRAVGQGETAMAGLLRQGTPGCIDRLGDSLVVLPAIDHPKLKHAMQHEVAPGPGNVGVPIEPEPVGILGHARQQCRLRERELRTAGQNIASSLRQRRRGCRRRARG